MKPAEVKLTRSYTMRARTESTTKTREGILGAVVALSEERLSLEIVLADVAARADVSVQTVLRHFGSRRGLFEQAQARRVAQVRAERATRSAIRRRRYAPSSRSTTVWENGPCGYRRRSTATS